MPVKRSFIDKTHKHDSVCTLLLFGHLYKICVTWRTSGESIPKLPDKKTETPESGAMCWYMSDAIVLQASRPRAWSALAVGCLLLMLLSGKQSYASQRESLWKELEELPSEVYFLPGDVNIGTIQVGEAVKVGLRVRS